MRGRGNNPNAPAVSGRPARPLPRRRRPSARTRRTRSSTTSTGRTSRPIPPRRTSRPWRASRAKTTEPGLTRTSSATSLRKMFPWPSRETRLWAARRTSRTSTRTTSPRRTRTRTSATTWTRPRTRTWRTRGPSGGPSSTCEAGITRWICTTRAAASTAPPTATPPPRRLLAGATSRASPGTVCSSRASGTARSGSPSIKTTPISNSTPRGWTRCARPCATSARRTISGTASSTSVSGLTTKPSEPSTLSTPMFAVRTRRERTRIL
mmetsp:Transcript_227/g.915  ORF Transcript_227/g.915 Transcript_227/m.915 type:complete len:266 (-) Transcript_227:1280-2077(-)